jgi:HK97 family phage prohead protease
MSNIAQNFTETQYKAMPGQVSTDEMQGIVECFVAGIGNKDSVGDICLPGAFNASLKRRKPRVVWGHNWNEPIGKVLDIYEVGPKDPRLPAKMRAQNIGGLFAKVQFNLKSERGREAFSNVSFFGEEQEWSIGYKTLDAVFDTTRQANLLKEVELYEVSPVLHGANQLTATISIKSEDQLMETQDSSSEVEEKGSPLRDPKGGLTAAGRAHFKRTEGANLKPGVKGPADTPTKMRRKGSFLTRFFTNPRGPMKDEKGRPTRLALSAAAWGEPVPQDASDAAKLAAKGRRMLERYENSKKSDEAEVEEKNYAIYSAMNEQENPITGKMGMLARQLGRHFGGNITVREADENMVIFDIDRDGKPETMRAAYHSPEPDVFMFGASKPVRAQVVYVPMDDDGNRRMMTPGMDARPQYDIPRAGISQKPHGDCGCGCKGGDSCEIGAEMKSWSDYKNDTPGIHMFIKTVDMEMFAAVNEVADDYGFDVELLNDGFVIPNIDWHGSDAQNEVIGVLEGVSEKGLARGLARGLRSTARRAGRGSTRDGDGDNKITNPRTGRDDLPIPPKPKMMPPREIPKEVPEKQPQTVPTRTPSRPTVPSRPVPSTPSRPAPTRPLVPAGRGSIAGQMGNRKNREALGRHILRQLREYELDISAPSKAPKRAMEMALDEIAQRNAMTRKQLDKILRRLIMQERRDAVLRRSGRIKSEETPNIYVSISEVSDLEVKSGLQINSRDIDTLLIDAEPEMMFAVKSAVDAIGDFYGFESFATDAGIQIKDASYLPGDAIEAIANAYMNVAGEYDLVDFELNRLAR